MEHVAEAERVLADATGAFLVEPAALWAAGDDSSHRAADAGRVARGGSWPYPRGASFSARRCVPGAHPARNGRRGGARGRVRAALMCVAKRRARGWAMDVDGDRRGLGEVALCPDNG